MNNVEISKYEYFVEEVENPKGNIIFLHAFSGNYHNKKDLRNYLSDYNFYGINLPGHGKSPYENNDEINLEYYIEVLKTFINSLKIKSFSIIAHSLGGLLALELTRIIPDKIEKLVLEAPVNPTILGYLETTKKLFPNSLEETELLFKSLSFNFEKWYKTDELKKKFLEKELEELNKSIHLKKLLSYDSLFSLANPNLRTVELNRKKTLVILGEKDGLVLTLPTYELFSKYKNYSITIYQDAAHFPIQEQKQKSYELIKTFLSETD